MAMSRVKGGLVAARTSSEADVIFSLIDSSFEIKSLGEPKDFLRIEIALDRTTSTITIIQEAEALNLVDI